MSKLLGVDEAAAELGAQARTLDDWRLKRKGPAYIKVGRLVKYRQEDLDAWVESQRQVPGERHLKAVV